MKSGSISNASAYFRNAKITQRNNKLRANNAKTTKMNVSIHAFLIRANLVDSMRCCMLEDTWKMISFPFPFWHFWRCARSHQMIKIHNVPTLNIFNVAIACIINFPAAIYLHFFLSLFEYSLGSDLNGPLIDGHMRTYCQEHGLPMKTHHNPHPHTVRIQTLQTICFG